MRAAPSVEFQAALRGAWWWVACGVWVLAAASLLGWLVWHVQVDGPDRLSAGLPALLAVSFVGLAVLSAAGTALWHLRRHPARLQWDGQVWRCTLSDMPDHEASEGQVDLMLDMGHAMLLRWRGDGPGDHDAHTVWLPVSRSTQPMQWHGLRVALRRGRAGVTA